jgi:hypothetical protein
VVSSGHGTSPSRIVEARRRAADAKQAAHSLAAAGFIAIALLAPVRSTERRTQWQ